MESLPLKKRQNILTFEIPQTGHCKFKRHTLHGVIMIRNDENYMKAQKMYLFPEYDDNENPGDPERSEANGWSLSNNHGEVYLSIK